MSTFSNTVGGLDPWSMPSDGVNGKYIHLAQDIKNWERRQYSKARRRESKRQIEGEMDEWDSTD